MRLFKRPSDKRLSLKQENMALWAAEWILLTQHKVANYLNTKTRRLKPRTWLLLLFSFCLLLGSYCLYLLSELFY